MAIKKPPIDPLKPPAPPKPGSLGLTWKGKDKAQVQADRTAKQIARTKAQQQPPPAAPPGAPPPAAPPGQPPPGGATPSDPWAGWNPGGQQPGGMDEMLMQILSGGPMAGMPPELPYGGYGGPTGGPGGIGGGGMDDPIQNYLSTVPVMDNMMRDRVSGAMGQAGLTGGRFSSGAQNTAAKIGGETALQQNQMLNDLLYNHTQQDLNRGLQASTAALGFGAQDLDRGLQAGMGLGQLGMGMDQAQQNRLNSLGQAGQWEQDRQDQFSMQRYMDFLQGRKGFVPELLNFAGSAAGGVSQPQGYPTTTSAGSPGIIDFLPLLLGMFS